MKKTYKMLLALITATVLVLALLSGCAAAQSQELAILPEPDTGTILLSVNPEIEVEFDENGLVLELEAKNEAARQILTGFRDYQGKPCQEVMGKLIKAIYEAGYFETNPDGSQRNIVVKLENGSVCPTDTFLEDIAQHLHDVVQLCGADSNTLTVAPQDQNSAGLIGLEKAKELALAHFGLAEATFVDRECKLDEGVYELEFIADGKEYECDVDAYTGKIQKAEVEAVPAPPVTALPEVPAPTVIGMEKAKELALAHFGLAEATFVDRECKLDGSKYELEFIADGTKYEIDIDATTGKVLKSEIESLSPAPTQPVTPAPTKPAPIGMEKAKELALAHFGLTEATFVDRECNLDEGVYELEFNADGKEYECDVDAYTGKILKAEVEAVPAPPVTAVPEVPAPTVIGMEKAKELALAHFGLTEAIFQDCELDEGVYELEFTANGMEYEIEINAITGKILKFESELMDSDDKYDD